MTNCEATCPDCSRLYLLLEEKNTYIEKLELQIQILKETLQNYKTKSCDICFCNINSEKNTSHTDETNIAKTDCILTENTEISCNNTNDFIISSTLEKSSINEDIKENKDKPQKLGSFAKEQSSSSEYIYDENYKMFYCVSTGYYYDRKTGLYYVPQNGAYYTYDYSENAYVLYTQGCTSSNETVTDAVKLISGNDDGESFEKEAEEKKETDDFCESVLNQVNNLKINDSSDSQAIEKEESLDDAKQDDGDSENVDEMCSKDWQTPAGTNLTVQDLVREVAEQQSGMSDYVYDENSRMYFSQSTGYYFDSVRNLLYDPQSGTYYKYDSETGTYEFFHQVDLTNTSPQTTEHREKEKLKARRRFWRKKQAQIPKNCTLPEETEVNNDEKSEDCVEDKNYSSPEEGEIFTSDSEEEEVEIQYQQFPYLESDLSKRSPCIRAIVKSSEKLKIGTLILITCTGAVIGRDKSNAVFIPDFGVSKAHAEVSFNNEIWKYSIKDLGSQNGTFVNESRLSQSKEESEPHVLNHGDSISLGACKLVFHIHVGYETCDDCEPGQIMADKSSQENKSANFKTKEEKEKERRLAMKQIKKKYGLEGMAFEQKHCLPNANSKYEDKAEMRRKTVGSDNPYEKVEASSLERTVDESNKGYQLLKKLGWKEGDSLGTTGSGISEPIPLRPWLSKAGLGSSEEQQASIQNLPEDKRKRKWIKAQERFQLLS